VLDCAALETPFARPAEFDLSTYWRASIARLEAELHPNEATVRLSPLGLQLFDALAHPYVKARMRLADGTEPDGWRIATMPVGKTVWHAATELLRLGAEAEVIAPAELREKMAELAGAMFARYAETQARRAARR
jgi:predicted DNA-binding transcriptional regulator YafY